MLSFRNFIVTNESKEEPMWKDCKRCLNPIKRGPCLLCKAPEKLNWPLKAVEMNSMKSSRYSLF